MNNIGALLDKTWVIFLIVSVDAVQCRRLQHAHIANQDLCQYLGKGIEIRGALIGVSEPLYRFVSIPDRTQYNLRIEVVRELRYKLRLNRKLLVQQA